MVWLNDTGEEMLIIMYSSEIIMSLIETMQNEKDYTGSLTTSWNWESLIETRHHNLDRIINGKVQTTDLRRCIWIN